jgi:hypothetical protein
MMLIATDSTDQLNVSLTFGKTHELINLATITTSSYDTFVLLEWSRAKV